MQANLTCFFLFSRTETGVFLIQRNCPINCFACLFNTWCINHWRFVRFFIVLRGFLHVPAGAGGTLVMSAGGSGILWAESLALTPREAEQGEHSQSIPKLGVILCPSSCGITWRSKSLFSQFSIVLKMFSWFSVTQPSRGRACFCLWNTSHSPTP